MFDWYDHHGLVGNSLILRAILDRGYAVLVPDMRGYGDSDKPAGTKGYDVRALILKIGFGAGQPLIPFHLKIDTDSCRGGRGSRGSRGSKKNDLYQ